MIIDQTHIDPELAMDDAVRLAVGVTGVLAGRNTLSDVLSDTDIRMFLEELMAREIIPVLARTQDTGDLQARADALVADLAASRDACLSAAANSSSRLDPAILETIRTRRLSGEPCLRLALVVAIWMRFASGLDEDGNEFELTDPRAERLIFLGVQARHNPDAIATAYFGEVEIFGEVLPNAAPFRQQVVTDLRHLLQFGVLETVALVNRTPA